MQASRMNQQPWHALCMQSNPPQGHSVDNGALPTAHECIQYVVSADRTGQQRQNRQRRRSSCMPAGGIAWQWQHQQTSRRRQVLADMKANGNPAALENRLKHPQCTCGVAATARRCPATMQQGVCMATMQAAAGQLLCILNLTPTVAPLASCSHRAIGQARCIDAEPQIAMQLQQSAAAAAAARGDMYAC
jgi:hypothetical protein